MAGGGRLTSRAEHISRYRPAQRTPVSGTWSSSGDRHGAESSRLVAVVAQSPSQMAIVAREEGFESDVGGGDTLSVSGRLTATESV